MNSKEHSMEMERKKKACREFSYEVMGIMAKYCPSQLTAYDIVSELRKLSEPVYDRLKNNTPADVARELQDENRVQAP